MVNKDGRTLDNSVTSYSFIEKLHVYTEVKFLLYICI